MQALATFETEQAARYLTTLCHHFGRKVDAVCNERDARITFPFGRCDLMASDHSLEFHAQAEDRMNLDTLVEVMTRHLERFAFREDPRLEWHPTHDADHSK